MRHFATFVSVLVLVWAVTVTLRVPSADLTWVVPLNVMAQCFFALIALWGLQKTAISHPNYLLFFNIGFFAVLVTAFICAGRFTAAFPPEIAVPLMILCAGFSIVVIRAAFWRMEILHQGRVPINQIPTVLFAGVLLLCGSLSLVSLLAESRPALKISAVALGSFWFLLAIFFFAYAVGNIHLHSTFQKLNNFVPMMLAIVAFSWLAFQLSGLQREVARETVQQVIGVTQ